MTRTTKNTSQGFRPRINSPHLFLILSLAFLFLLLLLSSGGEAREIVVDKEGGGNYTSLYGAVSDSSWGDTILVKKGEYPLDNPWLHFRSGTTILGEDREECRLFFNDSSSVLRIYRDDITISNCTITSSHLNNRNRIVVSGAENFFLVNCTIYNIRDRVVFSSNYYGVTFENNTLWDSPLEIHPGYLDSIFKYSLGNNTINGKKLEILIDQKDKIIDASAGGFILVNCTNIRFRDMEMSKGNNGICIFFSSDIHVENCSIVQTFYHGVYVQYSDAIYIDNTTITTSEDIGPGYADAIYCTGSSQIVVANNSLHASGIYLSGGKDSEINGNTITGSEDGDSDYTDGIYCRYASPLVITGNSLHDLGIYVLGGKNDEIKANTITGEHGITLKNSREAVVTGNTMEAGGVRLGGEMGYGHENPSYYYHTLTDNTISEKPIYYYRNMAGITVPEDAGQAIVIDCRNVTLRHLTFHGAADGVLLFNSTRSLITECESRECGFLVRMIASNDNRIENCTAVDGGGINLLASLNNFLAGNTISNCPTGISLQGSTTANTTIKDNTISHCLDDGVSIAGSRDTLIERNTISHCQEAGIYLGSNNVTIVNNTITQNSIGIELRGDAEDNKISHNNIHDNTGWGVWGKDVTPGTVDVSYNWWGHSSGPFHIDQNPNGDGDNASWRLNVDPWLKGRVSFSNEKEKNESGEEDSGSAGLYMLSLFILILFFLLIIVVRLPEEYFKKTRPSSQTSESTENRKPPHHPPQRINSCPHCGGEFELATLKRPIRFTCHFCGKKIEFE